MVKIIKVAPVFYQPSTMIDNLSFLGPGLLLLALTLLTLVTTAVRNNCTNGFHQFTALSQPRTSVT